MIGMTGIELSAELKKRMADNRDVIIILMSAADESAIAAEAKAAGISNIYQKPLFPSTIAQIVSDFFGSAVTHSQVEADASEEFDFAGHRILLAEDVEVNREIVMALLEPTGIEIDCAENGVEAVDMFAVAPDRYDLIFMDMQMPEMDGLTASITIRAMDTEKAKTIPIIAMTANVFREDVEKCLSAGMNDHIGKPLNFEEVLKKLKQYL